ncbi:MAG: hypothetical protein WB711_01725 [Terriglobales bacterium]
MKITDVRDEVAAQQGAPHAREVYSKPEERKRVTGSAIGMGSRLKIQRATANPNAA